MKRAAFAVLAALALSVSSSYAQGRFPLASEDFGKDGILVFPMGRQGVPLDEVKLTQLKAPPKDLAADAKYGVLKARGRDIVFALADDTLYVDTDGDGDLSDEKALKPIAPAAAEEKGWGTPRKEYGVITVASATPGREVRLAVTALMGKYLLVSPASCRAGRVWLAGKDYRVALLDRDFDGKFESWLSVPLGSAPGLDRLAIDLDGDGKFDPDFYAGEVMFLSKMRSVGGAYYSVEIEPDGSAITLENVEPKMGTLDVGTAEADLVLFSDCGLTRVSGGNGSWQLPEGSYHTVRIRLTRAGKDGVEQSVTGYGEMGALSEFEIASGKTLSLKMGPPLTLKTTVSADQDTLRVSLALMGQGGETYTPMVDYGTRPAGLPTLRVVGESGTVLSSGEFEFG